VILQLNNVDDYLTAFFLGERPGSHTFRLESRVTDALGLKTMHKAELKGIHPPTATLPTRAGL
jgi:hypothetical protein